MAKAISKVAPKSSYAHTHKLKSPIEFGDETITEINLRKPKAKDLRGLSDKLNMDDMLNLTVKISDQPKSVVDDLEMEDAMAVMKVVGDFFGDGHEIGQS